MTNERKPGEIKKWSVYFQTPEYLEQTRKFLILPEYEPLIRSWCGVKNGMRILDVGCGTGYFTRLLTRGDESVQAVGIDLEEPFIRYAREAAAALPIEFLVGDALNLPFEDDSFDLVTSHTFFTSISDPVRAMDEMKRVLKPGGMIASVTAMNFTYHAVDMGLYPKDCKWVLPFQILMNKLYTAYDKLNPVQSYIPGVNPARMPRFFAEQGLKQISAYPIGKMTSWSNAAIPAEQKLQWLDLYYRSEVDRLDAFMALPEMKDYFTETDAARYRELLNEKCLWLRAHPDENEVWEWNGGANLLVTGIRQ